MEDQIDITIETLGARGDGIGHLADGRAVFVPGALPGEAVRVTLGDAREGGVSATLDAVLTPSEDRIEALCRHYERCGGCVLQHIDAQAYRDFKVGQVQNLLARHDLAIETIEGPYVSPPGARRRATFASYKDGTDRFVLGFNEQRSNKIVDLEECPVLNPRLMALVPLLREILPNILQREHGMDIAVTESGGMVDMVMRPWVKKQKPTEHLPRHIVERLSVFAEKADLARLSWQKTADDETDLLTVVIRHPFIVDFSGVMVNPPPGAFLQATPDGEKVLAEAVVAAMPRRAKKVADLYAGCGTFTFALGVAKYKVHAVEGFAPAYNALKVAMPGKPVTAEKRDLAREPLMPKELNAYDAVVLDPPRVGALEQVKMLARSTVDTIIYVSCNPASFARDGEVLKKAGYVFSSLRIVDQFLWSPHTELVGVFRRPSKRH